MQMWGLAVDDGPVLTLRFAACRHSRLLATLADSAGFDDCVREGPFPLPSLFPRQSYADAVAFIELVEEHGGSGLHLDRPLRDTGDLREAGAPDWALAWLWGLLSRGGSADVPHAAARGRFGQHASREGWRAVFNALQVADLLGIDSMASLTAAAIASRVCGWTHTQRQVLFAQSGAPLLAPQEELALRSRNTWAEGR